MRTARLAVLSVAGAACIGLGAALAATQETPAPRAEPSRLAVLWSSGDPDVAHRMVLMYTHAAKKNAWFGEVRLIVWGPSARLVAGDKDLQAKVKAMMDDGVQFQACVVCADMYGVSPALRAMGIEVKPMGKPLSELIQDDGWDVLTF